MTVGEVDVEELVVDILDDVVVVLFTVDVDVDVEDEVDVEDVEVVVLTEEDEVLVILIELVVEEVVVPNGPWLHIVAIG